MTLTIESNFDPSELENKRLFIRYEIGISEESPLSGFDPWKITLAILGSLRPIAGEVTHRKKSRLIGEDDKNDLDMWFLSRIPVLPQDLITTLKDPKIKCKVQLRRYGWSPSGIKNIPEEDLRELENIFNSNIVIQEFLEDEEPD